MAATTATWAIPYAQSTDRLCDGYLFIQQMAERVDAILDAFDVDLARTEVVPTARVSAVTSQSVIGSPNHPVFNQVDWDNANLVNLSVDATSVSDVNAALNVMGTSAQWFSLTSSAVGNAYFLELNGSEFHQRDNAPGSASFPANGSIQSVTEASTSATTFSPLIGFDGTGTTGVTVNPDIRFWMLWYSDLP